MNTIIEGTGQHWLHHHQRVPHLFVPYLQIGVPPAYIIVNSGTGCILRTSACELIWDATQFLGFQPMRTKFVDVHPGNDCIKKNKG
jgi:hypothetical protein